MFVLFIVVSILIKERKSRTNFIPRSINLRYIYSHMKLTFLHRMVNGTEYCSDCLKSIDINGYRFLVNNKMTEFMLCRKCMDLARKEYKLKIK